MSKIPASGPNVVACSANYSKLQAKEGDFKVQNLIKIQQKKFIFNMNFVEKINLAIAIKIPGSY